MTSKTARVIAAGLAMGLLILDPKTALTGAQEGLELCIRSVIPALFPFVSLSVWLTGNLGPYPILRPLGRMCRIPAGSEGLLLTGALGGYPVGAQAVTQAWQAGLLSKEDARRMLGFCSNAGPAFIFGMLAPLFADPAACWWLWGIHILSFLLTALLLPGGRKVPMRSSAQSTMTLPHALQKALRVMAGICGWVLMFRIVICYCDRWFLWLLPSNVQVLLSGLLELTNGCLRLAQIPSEGDRLVLCSGILAFGGICVGMQTVSVTGKLGTGAYLPGKILQTLLSVLLASLVKIIVAF